jgi:ABC-type uncharacterized transport system auxiliary subunit
MNKWRVALLAAPVVGLLGCGAPRPISYYQLQVPAAPTPSSFTYPVDVVVGRIRGSDLLEGAPIVYKTQSNQIGTYQYHRWSDPPVLMIEAKLTRLLRTSGEYESVSGAGNPTGGDLVLRGRLYDFAEVDGDRISALVSLELELFNRRTAKILWSRFYTATEPGEGKEVPAVARALDRNLDRGLKEMMAGLSQHFAANPPAKLQASGPGDGRAK